MNLGKRISESRKAHLVNGEDRRCVGKILEKYEAVLTLRYWTAVKKNKHISHNKDIH